MAMAIDSTKPSTVMPTAEGMSWRASSAETDGRDGDGSDRGKELKLRTPLRRFGNVDELVGAGIFLASESASFVNGEILAVDGGFLASGVNQ